jgi:hypothetical protein
METECVFFEEKLNVIHYLNAVLHRINVVEKLF